MALPKFMAPRFELTVPSSGEKIEYRPYLVKEEKVLLIAQEGGEKPEIRKAIKQIVESCIETEDFDTSTLTTFDLDYMFLKIRSKSVNNIVSFIVTDPEDKKQYEFDIDLEAVKVDMAKAPEKKIMLNDKVGVMLKWPSASMFDDLAQFETETEIAEYVIGNCIDYIFDDKEIYPWDQESEKEKSDFINNMPVKVNKKLKVFMKNIPSMEYDYKYTNSEGTERTIRFSALEDFFAMG
jgi:hypothetical protein